MLEDWSHHYVCFISGKKQINLFINPTIKRQQLNICLALFIQTDADFFSALYSLQLLTNTQDGHFREVTCLKEFNSFPEVWQRLPVCTGKHLRLTHLWNHITSEWHSGKFLSNYLTYEFIKMHQCKTLNESITFWWQSQKPSCFSRSKALNHVTTSNWALSSDWLRSSQSFKDSCDWLTCVCHHLLQNVNVFKHTNCLRRLWSVWQ